jgi:hypothetical protein
MTDSIENGRIIKEYRLFFPSQRDGQIFPERGRARCRSAPIYYRAVLKPIEGQLKKRASILRAKRADWWGLMHPRTGTFALDHHPRIVSNSLEPKAASR